MAGLNYYRIAQALGGTLTQIKEHSFGALGALQTGSERFRLVRDIPGESSITPDQNKIIVKAFESVRNGFELDRVLVDPVLAKQLIKECRSLNVDAPVAQIFKRLQAIRKAQGAYGIKFKPTKRSSELETEPFHYAAEMGFVQLTYRRKASIDDIVTNPDIGDVFVQICKSISPKGTPQEFKWAALELRKKRSFNRTLSNKLLSVNADDIERKLEPLGSLDRLSISSVPAAPGIFALSELNGSSQYLYIGSGDDLRQSVQPFADAKPFMALAGRFWSPSLRDITVNAGEFPKRWNGASFEDWGFRLIQQRRPLFNIPVEINKPEKRISTLAS